MLVLLFVRFCVKQIDERLEFGLGKDLTKHGLIKTSTGHKLLDKNPEFMWVSFCSGNFESMHGRGEKSEGISQHLARMKNDGLVESNRHNNWMIYSLPKKAPKTLDAHLRCLQDCVQTEPVFISDLAALRKLKADCDRVDNAVFAKAS